MRTKLLKLLFTLALVASAAATLWGYAFLSAGDKWPDGAVVIHEQLGPGSGTLIDGSTSWNQAFEGTLATWNQNLGRLQFQAVRDSTAAIGEGNNVNNITFSDTFRGRSFDGSTLAVTVNFVNSLTHRRIEADIVFNRRWSWDSYRGNLRPGSLQDIRRVALHEVGHVLGLDHPDEYGQQVSAIMNSTVSNLDSLTADDIAGAQALYGGPIGTVNNGTVVFPPRNEVLDFRTQLEAYYADVLRRKPQATYVNNEGEAVWMTDFLRYMVNLCGYAAALNNVMIQIAGRPAPSVCGNAPAGQVNFPPRNLSLDARNWLEVTYRDTLRAAPVLTAVDIEGAAVWNQEYLGLRVNGCTHGDASQKVFLQIAGGGVQPGCRAAVGTR